jgi:hypothetical protein
VNSTKVEARNRKSGWITSRLTGPGVRPGALTTDRKALAVTEAAIAADVAKTRDSLLNLTTELSFHDVLVVEEGGDLGEIVFGKIASTLVGADPGSLADLVGEERADPVDIAQRDHGALVVRDVNTEDTRHPSNLREAEAEKRACGWKRLGKQACPKR